MPPTPWSPRPSDASSSLPGLWGQPDVSPVLNSPSLRNTGLEIETQFLKPKHTGNKVNTYLNFPETSDIDQVARGLTVFHLESGREAGGKLEHRFQFLCLPLQS